MLELSELLIAVTDQPIHVDSSVVYGLHGRTLGRWVSIRVKSARGAARSDQLNFSSLKGSETADVAAGVSGSVKQDCGLTAKHSRHDIES
jgi:hypothetical protein